MQRSNNDPGFTMEVVTHPILITRKMLPSVHIVQPNNFITFTHFYFKIFYKETRIYV